MQTVDNKLECNSGINQFMECRLETRIITSNETYPSMPHTDIFEGMENSVDFQLIKLGFHCESAPCLNDRPSVEVWSSLVCFQHGI